jgi:hypothetical protein
MPQIILSTTSHLFQKQFQMNRFMQHFPSADSSWVCITENNYIQANLSGVRHLPTNFVFWSCARTMWSEEQCTPQENQSSNLLPSGVVFLSFITSSLFVFSLRYHKNYLDKRGILKNIKFINTSWQNHNKIHTCQHTYTNPLQPIKINAITIRPR